MDDFPTQDIYKWIDKYHEELCDTAIGLAFRTVDLLREGEMELAMIEAGMCLQAQDNRDEFRGETKHSNFGLPKEQSNDTN